MKFTSGRIITIMKEQGVVPLLTHDDPEETAQIVTIAYECGLRAFEFTNRRARSFEVFKHLVNNRHQYPDMALGIGTIMDPETTQQYIDAGANFIISPILNIAMGQVCSENRILWIAGCATPTEIVVAKDHGSDLIKIFPASIPGPGFVRAMLQVMPDLNLMITGGVDGTKENLSSWFDAGATCVGMGSQLFPPDILRTKNWKQLEDRFKTLITLLKSIRGR